MPHHFNIVLLYFFYLMALLTFIMTGIANLKLKNLQLWDNLLTGSLPDEFYDMPLVEFDCEDNNFVGTISEDIKKMYDLEEFWIGNNQFTGTIPDNISKTNLTIAKFRKNNFTGTLPESIGELVDMGKFILRICLNI